MAKKYANTKKYINRLGFGAWQLGNTDFWGYMAIEDGVALVKEAIKSGINFFDTAPGYAYGLSESIIGQAVKDCRDKVVINTKFGHTASGETDFSVFSLREQIYESLERLQTDYLDSILLHNPSMDILEGKTLHFQELAKIKEEGLIRAYGVSIDTYEEFRAVLDHVEVDVVEILFNIFFQEARPLFNEAHQKGISIITKVPLDSGWLTGKYDEFSEFEGIRSRWDDETILRRANLVREIKDLTHAEVLTKYSLGFILSFKEVTAVIPGIKNIEQLKDHIENLSYELPSSLKEAFIQLYDEKIKDEPLYW
ncbi:MAG: aldo/keto reductase [Acholeplasmataceae bacterium]|jgi:aryl-alcohol dehydrogenase-like predicted oxidoreductase|nr:aldo/keto reductase [Acholeplasmataceae bacterium]